MKTVVFVCDGRFVLALVPGDARASTRSLVAVAGGRRARVAAPDEVLAATEFEPGGVAPFPRRPEIRAFVDSALLDQPLVWIGAGSSRHLAALTPFALVRIARAEPAELSG